LDTSLISTGITASFAAAVVVFTALYNKKILKDNSSITDEPKHITEYDSVTRLYSLGTVLAFRKILLYGQIYSKIKELCKNDNIAYVEQIRRSFENIIDLLRDISKTSGVKPPWFYYDNLLLGDLLTEEIEENFRLNLAYRGRVVYIVRTEQQRKCLMT
jgi:hypothetical protein